VVAAAEVPAISTAQMEVLAAALGIQVALETATHHQHHQVKETMVVSGQM
jgi:hypothetical protein